MYRGQQPRIAIVTRETRLQGLLERWATKGQARFVFQRARAAAALQAGEIDQAVAIQESNHNDFEEFEEENQTYEDAVRTLRSSLDLGLPVQVINRKVLPTVDFDLCAVVVCMGQDGLVANTAKYVGDVPIVGVNPDPARYDGVLLPFQVGEARRAVQRVLNQQARLRDVTLAQATLHDGQKLLAFNDIFIGAKSHVSARYDLRVGGQEESQSSSGILVSTGAGSTGWMSSVFNMARGIGEWMGGAVPDPQEIRLDWSMPALLWAVREPFRSRTTSVNLACGIIAERRVDQLVINGRDVNFAEELIVESQMPTGGVIFSDGVESDFLEFNGGSIVRIGVARQRARLVVK